MANHQLIYDLTMRTINLTQAIIRINEAVYQPSSHLPNTKHITSTERDILFTVREELISTSKMAHIKLVVNNEGDFDQERVTEEQLVALKNVYEDVLNRLKTVVSGINTYLDSHNPSEPFLECFREVRKLIIDSMELMQRVNIQKERFLNQHFKKNIIYRLCKLKGALFIPIAQDFDPLIGGFEDKGKLEVSKGNCGGKIISWLESCAKTTEIRYPFYAGKNHSEYQQKLLNIKEHYKIIYQGANLSLSLRFTTSHLKKNCLYYFSIQWEDSAHAIGIRIRQDNIIELFDPNYMHLFCYDKSTFELIFGYLLTEYSLEGEVKRFALFEADVLQCDSTQSMFPHKTQIIQAANKYETVANEAAYIEIIKRIFLTCNKIYKNDKAQSDRVFKLFSFNLKQIIEQIHYPVILDQLCARIHKISPLSTFFSSDENKESLLTILKDRNSIVGSAEYQANLKDRYQAIKDLVEMESNITQELNKVRHEIDEENQNADKPSTDLNGKLILLTQKSLKLFRIFLQIKSNNAAVILNNRNYELSESPSNYLLSWLNKKFGSNASIKSNPVTALQEYVNEKMNNLSLRYSRLSENKTLQINIAIEKLFNVLRLLDKKISVLSLSDSPEQSYPPSARVNLSTLRKHLVILQNDLRLAENADTIKVRLQKLTRLHADQIDLLCDSEADNLDIMNHIANIVRHFNDDSTDAIDEHEGLNTGFQHEIIALATSLQCMISYFEAAKEDFFLNSKQGSTSKRTANQLVLQSKVRQKINLLGSRVRDLIKIKNILIAECRQKANPNLFIKLSSQIKKEYGDIFPIDFTLTENYSHFLDKLIDRNKPIILNSEDKLLIAELENCFSYLNFAAEKLSKRVKDFQQIVVNKQVDKHANILIHRALFNNKTNIAHNIKLLSEFKSKVEYILFQEIEPQNITNFVNSDLLLYANNKNMFSITKFLERNLPNTKAEQSIVNTESTLSLATTNLSIQSELDERKLRIMMRKISELVNQISDVNQKLAVEALYVAGIELSTEGDSVIEKDYANAITKNLNSIFEVYNKLSQDQITLLKKNIITLNYFFRGKLGINTDYTWGLLDLSQHDATSNLVREQYGIRSFMFFQKLCSDIESNYLQETEKAYQNNSGSGMFFGV